MYQKCIKYHSFRKKSKTVGESKLKYDANQSIDIDV